MSFIDRDPRVVYRKICVHVLHHIIWGGVFAQNAVQCMHKRLGVLNQGLRIIVGTVDQFEFVGTDTKGVDGAANAWGSPACRKQASEPELESFQNAF